ncbi:MAG: cyclase family protein [Microbacteriaceae bacterium]|jgi:kynurenine formamidase|nr:cyclase family protein [Microbacteriaceae bacterium]
MTVRIVGSCDLSHPLQTGMPVYPNDPEVSMGPATTIAADGYNVAHLTMGSQSGTHIDAPFHFLEDGLTIDEFSPDVFVGEAIIADVTGLAPNTQIGANLIPAPRGPRQILLISTGWSEFWGSSEYFSHPYLSASAAEKIVGLGYKAVGIDALSVDQTEASTGNFDAHDVILGAGIPIAENLRGLSAVDWDAPWVSLLPLRIANGDGAPIRAVAFHFEHS